ncbi:unnamed protein product, partial [Sphacelaria rigidula]
EISATLPAVEGVYAVGRKDGSIVFANDRSVSRRHAEIRVGAVPGGDPTKQPVWWWLVNDVGSKLKTFVNEVDTGDHNKEVPLKNGDVVKVGSLRCVR